MAEPVAPEAASPPAPTPEPEPPSGAPDPDTATPQPAAPTAALPSPPKPKPPRNAKLRTIHPLSPTRHACLEMVSVCSGEPRRCTSSPLHLECDEVVEVKSRHEWLRCVCP
jgi:hypothetical protein